MTDLTKIEKPFGLLDAETQIALRECGGPWETYSGERWRNVVLPSFVSDCVYRQKPQPREYEAWAALHEDGGVAAFYLSKEDAVRHSTLIEGRVIRLTGVDDEA